MARKHSRTLNPIFVSNLSRSQETAVFIVPVEIGEHMKLSLQAYHFVAQHVGMRMGSTSH